MANPKFWYFIERKTLQVAQRQLGFGAVPIFESLAALSSKSWLLESLPVPQGRVVRVPYDFDQYFDVTRPSKR